MNKSSIPQHPQHREKLLDLKTEEARPTQAAVPQEPETLSGAAPGNEPAQSGTLAEAAVHVSPIGENWEVETEAATLGQADSKSEAEELAKGLAEEVGASKVAIHTSDGVVEKEIAVKREPGATEPE